MYQDLKQVILAKVSYILMQSFFWNAHLVRLFSTFYVSLFMFYKYHPTISVVLIHYMNNAALAKKILFNK